MSLLAQIAVAFVAFQHLSFLVLEMFLWETPTGLKVFRNTRERAAATAVLAKNQGLYNGFLAAGLVWSLVGGGVPVATFFLGCVVVAGLYGGITVARSIWVVQALPAVVALMLVLVRSG